MTPTQPVQTLGDQLRTEHLRETRGTHDVEIGRFETLLRERYGINHDPKELTAVIDGVTLQHEGHRIRVIRCCSKCGSPLDCPPVLNRAQLAQVVALGDSDCVYCRMELKPRKKDSDGSGTPSQTHAG